MTRLRWLVPAAVALVGLPALGLVPTLSASAGPALPPITAQALVAKVLSARVGGLSGTVATSTDLGLPALPAGSLPGSGSSLLGLLTSPQTLEVWTAGRSYQRVAVLTPMAETDVIRAGTRLWTWSSTTRSVGEATLPARSPSGSAAGQVDAMAATLTPMAVADRVIAAITPSTVVTVGRSAFVAHRKAYELLLSPRTAGSLVQTVAIAVDSTTGVPLRVQVFAVGQHPAALSIGFTSVSLRTPALSVFRFAPPPGSTVHPLRRPARSGTAPAGAPSAGHLGQLGQGWDAVLALGQVKLLGKNAALFLRDSTPADGGRLWTTSLVTAFFAPDGTLYLGAVTPTVLLAAVATGK